MLSMAEQSEWYYVMRKIKIELQGMPEKFKSCRIELDDKIFYPGNIYAKLTSVGFKDVAVLTENDKTIIYLMWESNLDTKLALLY